MRLNYNYQSGTFTIEAEDKEEAIQLKMQQWISPT